MKKFETGVNVKKEKHKLEECRKNSLMISCYGRFEVMDMACLKKLINNQLECGRAKQVEVP